MVHLQRTVVDIELGPQAATWCGIGVPLSRVNHVDSPTFGVPGDRENFLEMSSHTPKVSCETCRDAEARK